jgi:hypothetical protein
VVPNHSSSKVTIRTRPYGVSDCADNLRRVRQPEGFLDADLYQLLAYCTALHLPTGHLVHAKGSAPHAAHRIRNTGIRIHHTRRRRRVLDAVTDNLAGHRWLAGFPGTRANHPGARRRLAQMSTRLAEGSPHRSEECLCGPTSAMPALRRITADRTSARCRRLA